MAVLVALALGITMVAGDTLMLSATHYKVGTPFNVATAKQANTLLPYWPDSALTVASIEAFDAISRGPPGPRSSPIRGIGQQSLWAETPEIPSFGRCSGTPTSS